MTRDPARDPAKARFAIINLVRLTGVAMVLLGILVAEGVIEWPMEAAYALVVLGMIEVFLMPRLLARRWRTPE